MVIKNASDTNNGGANPRPITRTYFNKLGKTLTAGQATNVASTISVTDVLFDPTFLKDIGVVTDEVFVPATWAGYDYRVKVGPHSLALSGSTLKNPVYKTAVPAVAGDVVLFLSPAEKALLQGILTNSSDLYEADYLFAESPEAGIANVAIGSLAAMDDEHVEYTNLRTTGAGDKWVYTDTVPRSYTSATVDVTDDPMAADYSADLGVMSVITSVKYYAFNFGNGLAEIGAKLAVDDDEGGPVYDKDGVHVGTLYKGVIPAVWKIDMLGPNPGSVINTYVGPAGSDAGTEGGASYTKTVTIGNVYVDGANWKFDSPTTADGAVTIGPVTGEEGAYVWTTSANNVNLPGIGVFSQNGSNWVVFGNDGKTYVGPVIANPPVGDYAKEETLGTLYITSPNTLQFTITGGAPVVLGKQAVVEAAATTAIAGAGTLSKSTALDAWIITSSVAGHTSEVFIGPDKDGTSAGTYTRTISIISEDRLNPDAVSETGAGIPVIVPTPQAVVVEPKLESKPDPEMVVEAKPLAEAPAVVVEPVKTAAVEAPKPKKARGKSLADLEAANKA